MEKRARAVATQALGIAPVWPATYEHMSSAIESRKSPPMDLLRVNEAICTQFTRIQPRASLANMFVHAIRIPTDADPDRQHSVNSRGASSIFIRSKSD
jgi:hypothetical protein